MIITLRGLIKSMQLNFKMHHRWGKQSKFILILMIKTTLVRNNHKFTLNKLLVGSIYSEASQNRNLKLNQKNLIKFVLKMEQSTLKT